MNHRNQYDIIGDIHGQADALLALLAELGYQQQRGAWRHAERKVIFVGDFIDLGPKQVETVMIARRMVDAGSALAVLGNHEFNAMAWRHPDPARPGDFLRTRNCPQWGEKHRHQHAAFLAEVEGKPIHAELIDWFYTLPLWLDLPEIRVVHACWHSASVSYLAQVLGPEARLSYDWMVAATDEAANEGVEEMTVFAAVEELIKGPEISLPDGYSFRDKYGIARTRMRARWWDNSASTYREAALLDTETKAGLPDAALPSFAAVYQPADKPVFIGHYWLTGPPTPLSEKVVCTDYSAGKGGPLTAYRWSGDANLSSEHYVQTPVVT
jgi:hypothetical protein